MTVSRRVFQDLLERDQRYKLEAYQFIRESLAYAHEELRLSDLNRSEPAAGKSRHITGQQLCEACRLYAIEQYGYLAKIVLNSWGIYETLDFGEIVYNLIEIEQMRKSDTDQREDFDAAYSFKDAFEPKFVFATSDDGG